MEYKWFKKTYWYKRKKET